MILADANRDETDLCLPGLERIAVIGETITRSTTRHIDTLAAFGSSWTY